MPCVPCLFSSWSGRVRITVVSLLSWTPLITGIGCPRPRLAPFPLWPFPLPLEDEDGGPSVTPSCSTSCPSSATLPPLSAPELARPTPGPVPALPTLPGPGCLSGVTPRPPLLPRPWARPAAKLELSLWRASSSSWVLRGQRYCQYKRVMMVLLPCLGTALALARPRARLNGCCSPSAPGGPGLPGSAILTVLPTRYA